MSGGVPDRADDEPLRVDVPAPSVRYVATVKRVGSGDPPAWCKCGDGFTPGKGGASADECVNCIFGKGEA